MVVGEDFGIHFVEIAAEVGTGIDVQFEVNLGEGQLTHVGRGTHVVARGDHLVEELLRDDFTRFVMAGEEIERLAIPAVVLHNLRGQLNEVPGDIGARERFHFHFAQQRMQQVAELVEDGFDFAVGQKGRLAVHRRAHVAHHQGQVGLADLACLHGIHPRPTALGLARMPIGIEGAAVAAIVCVMDLVELHLRVPHFHFVGGLL